MTAVSIWTLLLVCVPYFSFINARVLVGSDGSIILKPSQVGGNVIVDGDIIVNGEYIGMGLANVAQSLQIADHLNMFYLSAHRYQQFQIGTPFGVASVEIAGNLFLAIAQNLSAPQLYRWNNVTNNFTSIMLPASQGFNRYFESFTIGSNTYLIDSPTPLIAPIIWEYSGGSFVVASTLPSNFAPSRGYTWEAFYIDGMTFLAQGTEVTVPNNIYMWTGTNFTSTYVDYDSLRAWKFFFINEVPYIANAKDLVNSELMTYNASSSSWKLVETYTTATAVDVKYFAIGTNTYLIHAEFAANQTTIRQWSGTSFVPYSYLPINKAKSFEIFIWEGVTYLFASTATTTQVYKWNPQILNFVLVTQIQSLVVPSLSNASVSKFFSAPDGNQYVYIGYPGTSFVYKLNLE